MATEDDPRDLATRLNRMELAFADFVRALARIETRLPNDLAEYPIDRHLREIRDELKAVNTLLFVKRNGGTAVVPGLARLEERAEDQDRIQSSIVRGLWWIAGMILVGFGALFWAMAQEYIRRGA